MSEFAVWFDATRHKMTQKAKANLKKKPDKSLIYWSGIKPF